MTFDSKSWKLAITALLVGFMVAATITFTMRSRRAPPVAAATPIAAAAPAADTLDADLDRCNRLGPNDPPDQACLAAWAEARRRFFGNPQQGARP